METPVADLWVAYQADKGDERLFESLCRAHIPLVKYVASRMLPSLHASVEHQDLVSYGMFGLMDAIRRFDPAAGTKFATFAHYRIQGAINDEMRSQAWEPRTVRSRYRGVERAVSDLEAAHRRPPTEEEVATHVGVSTSELRRIQHDSRSSRVSSLSAPITGVDGSESSTLADMVAGPDLGDVGQQVGELGLSMADAVTRLPANEQTLLQLIYVRHLTLKNIARVLHVTESWISHLHTRAMVNLQRTMAGQY